MYSRVMLHTLVALLGALALGVGGAWGQTAPGSTLSLDAVIKNIEFPKPSNGGSVQVNYPFSFRAAGQQ